LEEDKIVSFLNDRGFDNIKDVGSDNLKNTYLGSKNPKRKIKPWWKIDYANVRRDNAY